MPIESAPRELDKHTKCGPQVLLGAEGFVDVGFFHDGSHCYGHRGEAGWFAADDWGEDRLLTASNLHPTHWMPLPEPPK
jgi:hypothetical protein